MTTFEHACLYAYQKFQEENNQMGAVEECSSFWLFHRKKGGQALVVYKDGRKPEDLTTSLQLKLYSKLKQCRVINY